MSVFCIPIPSPTSTKAIRPNTRTAKSHRRRSIFDIQPDIAERQTSLYFYSTSSYSTHRLNDFCYSSDEDDLIKDIPQLPLPRCLSEPEDLDQLFHSSLDLRSTLDIQDRYMMSVSEGEILARAVGRQQLRNVGVNFETEDYYNTKTRASIMAPTPPPRSTLRGPPPRAASYPARPSVSERLSSLHHLSVDQPLPQPRTPSLSSSSSHDGDAESPVTPIFPVASGSSPPQPAKRLSHTAEGLVSWGRRRKTGVVGVEKDEYKVKDGAVKRKASSGVYTPPTFPGPAGPHPPLPGTSTAVYTPRPFTSSPAQLYQSTVPTRSASISSTDSSRSDFDSTPQTPVTPAISTRLSVSLAGAGKTLSQFKRRISSQTLSSDSRNASNATLNRESYFPAPPGELEYTSAHSRKSSYGPVTPLAAAPYNAQSTRVTRGLGIGLVENDGQTSVPMPGYARNRSQTMIAMESPLELDENSMRREKGLKRKPVPKIVDQELETRLAGLEIENVGHAL